MKKSHFQFLLLTLLAIFHSSHGFGSMGPISASFGDNGLFCAIDASGEQTVICWNANNSSSKDSSSIHYSTVLPPMSALSGGEGFQCGILANSSQAFCWDSMGTSESSDLVPDVFRFVAYSAIAAGKDHVCAIRGSYYSESDSGIVDCWDVVRVSNNSLSSRQSSRFYDQSISNMVVFRKVVSGDGFSCGVVRDGGVLCWGPNSSNLGVSRISEDFVTLASGTDSVCGIAQMSGEIKCWGGNDSYVSNPPAGVRFVLLSAGSQHFCGVREDSHGVECWGNFNASLIPKESGFLAIASSNFLTCGIREGDLVLDCWFSNESSPVSYDPPLELCSPGLCTPDTCAEGMFAFNASLLHEQDLTTLCVRKDLKICLPCGVNCSEGFFPSSSCTVNADRVCTSCSLCQNSSCSGVCKLHSLPGMQQKHWYQMRQLVLIIGCSASGCLLILIAVCLLPRLMTSRNGDGKIHILSCIRKRESKIVEDSDQHAPVAVVVCPAEAQVFRLSELKDATNGFKEFNELGRGSYGFVYKAVLPDGRQVAVKRANAATIIHTNSRDFEMQLEILCNARHANIVNLLGYCAEMGERLLVYEFVPRGTLHDHLHGGMSTLNWSLRLKIAMQAAKGLEYLHKEVVPPIVHRDVKSSKILLDADLGARIADFGLLAPSERDLNADMSTDVYGFGVVLLEILSGRKAYDGDCMPPNIVDWALPQIRQGKAAAIIDRYAALPRNVEPLLRFADIAELALCDDPGERVTMSDLALLLDQLVNDGLIL